MENIMKYAISLHNHINDAKLSKYLDILLVVKGGVNGDSVPKG